jgi:hypothetical protein
LSSIRPPVLFRWLVFFLFAVSASAEEPRDISAELETVRAKYHLPACASAVIENGRIGATGLRRADHAVPVSATDLWQTRLSLLPHAGSE